MKCASTWVSECLRHHPQVLLSNPKETAYFNTRTGLDDYMSFFEGLGGYLVAGEFTPTYLPNSRVVSRRILDTLGKVKILVTLRDPVRRYLSHYRWILGRRDDFDTARFARLDLSTFRRANSVEPRVLEWGRYREDLEVFMDAFGAEAVHVMIYEEIFADPRAALRRLFEFLGVDPQFVPPSIDEKVRQGYVPRSKLLEQAKVHAYFLVKNNAAWAIDPLKRLGLEKLLRRINQAPARPLEVAPEVEAALADYYREDIEQLRALLGKPLAQWGRG